MCNKNTESVNQEYLSLYQAIASDIRLWKTQQWQITYYAIWVFAGLVGLFELSRKSHTALATLLPLVLLTPLLSMKYMIGNEMLQLRDRRRLAEIMKHLSPEAYDLVKYYPKYWGRVNYDSFWYNVGFWLPLMASLLLGCFLVCAINRPLRHFCAPRCEKISVAISTVLLL